jgi:hypothetical protein
MRKNPVTKDSEAIDTSIPAHFVKERVAFVPKSERSISAQRRSASKGPLLDIVVVVVVVIVIVVGGCPMISQSFTIGGYRFELSKEETEQRLRDIQPERVRKVFVEVNGKKYPAKQALIAAESGLIRSGFTTQDAIRVLRKLGFKLGEQ